MFFSFPEKNRLLIPHTLMDNIVDGKRENSIPLVLLRVVPSGDSLKYKITRATIRATKTMCLEE